MSLPRSMFGLLFCLGCAVAPTPDGALRVELLDRFFVRVDGERIARDEFVLRIRQRCRQARAAGVLPPTVLLSWVSLRDQRIGRDLMNQLLLAGVKHVTLGS